MSKTSASATTKKPAFVNGAQACKTGGLSRAELSKLALVGRIRTLAEPGQSIRYCVEDLERIAAAK